MNIAATKHPLDGLQFDNRFTRELPGDPESGSRRRQVHQASYSRVDPTPVAAPRLVAYWPEVAELLGLDPAVCETQAFAEVFTGNRLLPGMDPHATCYGGHQFGNWAGQLGDGRAINLGEVVNPNGEHWMLQLKGAGPTPYSRSADGYAVLRSSIREFLCSEAMHFLGVPTTRALSLTLSGESVVRDILYDGHPAPEPGAVVCRVARSFTRFGHFEILAARREHDLLARFTDFTIAADFPELEHHTDPQERYAVWFDEVCRRTAAMVVEWMRVGFVHGVMNTDNMSVLGLTIDYGPYGWLDDYDPDWTPNTTDAGGRRYRFGYQARIAHWNLAQLANAIYPLIEDTAPLEAGLKRFERDYLEGWRDMMLAKLGLTEFQSATDAALLNDLNDVLQVVETDMTIFFRALADLTRDHSDPLAVVSDAFYTPTEVTGDKARQIRGWLERYQRRLGNQALDHGARRTQMNTVNPRFVLRNYLAQTAIDAAEQGDFKVIHQLQDVLRNPYDDHPEYAQWAGKRPDWARERVGCSMLSCSS
ncbi:MAG: YdiU family protein [Gammaproteobacteria bacterium]|nr:YdiU family protein [Gammaproteobacteria bacterium]